METSRKTQLRFALWLSAATGADSVAVFAQRLPGPQGRGSTPIDLAGRDLQDV